MGVKRDPSWMLPAGALRWISENIPKGSTILELGSGHGSRDLALFYRVFSVEHDPEWLSRFKGVNYIHAPIVNGWYDTWSIREFAPKNYDLLILDGPPGSIGRLGILGNGDLFNWEVPVLVDDLHRPQERRLSRLLALSHDLKTAHVAREKDGRKWGVLSRRL